MDCSKKLEKLYEVLQGVTADEKDEPKIKKYLHATNVQIQWLEKAKAGNLEICLFSVHFTIGMFQICETYTATNVCKEMANTILEILAWPHRRWLVKP